MKASMKTHYFQIKDYKTQIYRAYCTYTTANGPMSERLSSLHY